MKKRLFLLAFMGVCALCALQAQRIVSIPGDDPLVVVKETPGMTAIFKTWGFIGDSLCSGEMETVDNEGNRHYKDLYEYSWGQCLCRACGAEGYNYSYGGQTAYGWINSPGKRTWEMAKVTPKQAYIIAMGCNDYSTERGPGSLETDVNLEDYTKNVPTYAGNMAGIIQRIQSINKDAKMFVLTRPRMDVGEEAYDSWNEIVRQLPSKFSNVYVIDLYRYGVCHDSTFRHMYYLNGHLNAAGYQYTAYQLMTYIDWIVRKHPTEFNNVPFIPTY